uniref:Uncharacterized protein n=1 Tax=Zea mays TaxID=4577 RepID=C4J7J6_MAIZE|nr:unknown [Zea mays]
MIFAWIWLSKCLVVRSSNRFSSGQ